MPDVPPQFDTVMETAQKKAEGESNTFAGRFFTWTHYKVRKEVKHLPQSALSTVAGHFVPIAGSKLTAKLFEKLRSRKIKGVLSNPNADAYSLSKAQAKEMRSLGEKIDENLTKFNDATTAYLQNCDRFAKEIQPAQAQTYFEWAAFSYYRMDHYTVKLLYLLNDLDNYLESVAQYLEECSGALFEEKERLRDAFANLPF